MAVSKYVHWEHSSSPSSAFLREQGDKHKDMSWWCLGSRAHSISQLQNNPKKKDAVIIKSIQHGLLRFGSWVDCLRERAPKYVKNLTTSPMVSVPFFIPNCARFPCCHSSQSVTHLSDSQWHCSGCKHISNRLQTATELGGEQIYSPRSGVEPPK